MKENKKDNLVGFKSFPKSKKLFLLIDAALIILLMISGVVSLNIKAEEDNRKFMVTFDSNGGSIVEKQLVLKNNKAVKPANPTKEAFVFVEWQLNKVVFDFNTKITSDIILTAVWENDLAPLLLVTFDSNGGSEVLPIEVRQGSAISPPLNPTRKNYVFKGWYLDKEYFDFNLPIMNSMTLVAKWQLASSTPSKKVEPIIEPEVIKKVREYLPGGSATVGAASLATRFIFGVFFPKN